MLSDYIKNHRLLSNNEIPHQELLLNAWSSRQVIFLGSKYLVSGNWLSAITNDFIETNTTTKKLEKTFQFTIYLYMKMGLLSDRANFIINSKSLTLDFVCQKIKYSYGFNSNV